MVQPIPEGYHSVTPYLIVKGASAAIDYYTTAFGAKELFRMPMGEIIGHAEMIIGNSHVMLADEFPEMGAISPETLGGNGSSLMIYVEDCDTVFGQAIAAGATEVRPVIDQFYGDRAGTLKDPFGHQWTIATHKEDLTPEQLNERFESWKAEKGECEAGS